LFLIVQLQLHYNMNLVFMQESDSKLADVFGKVSDKLREKARFARTSVPAVLKAAGQKKDTLVVYRPKVFANKFEPDFVVYDGAVEKEAVIKFINAE